MGRTHLGAEPPDLGLESFPDLRNHRSCRNVTNRRNFIRRSGQRASMPYCMEIRLDDLRNMLVENCMLKVEPAEIAEDMPLFGPGGLGLDSIDAMQMTLAVEQFYKIPIKDPATAREALQSLGTLRDWLRRNV